MNKQNADRLVYVRRAEDHSPAGGDLSRASPMAPTSSTPTADKGAWAALPLSLQGGPYRGLVGFTVELMVNTHCGICG